MAMKKSIGRTLAHIDVAANTSVRIHEDFSTPTPVIDISNEVGRVKRVSLFFYFFRTHLYTRAVPLLSLTGDALQFSVCSSCPTYGLGSCHLIVSVLPTKHLSDHVRP